MAAKQAKAAKDAAKMFWQINTLHATWKTRREGSKEERGKYREN